MLAPTGFHLPLDILEEIFLNVPPHQVVRGCRLVCHEWKEVADRDSFWRERCRREGYHLCHASKVPTNWKHFYFISKNRRNLLRNPRGEDEFNGWTLVENGGDHWKIEAPMVPHPNEGVQKNFVTSFGMCLKSQLIDLEEEGYNSSFMDEIQPHIRISDWYAPRWDCGSEYIITVELLNDKKAVVQEFAPEPVTFPQWNDQQWNQAFDIPLDILEEIFLNVPPHQVVRGCRLVCHEWKEVADRDSFWRERCRREGYHLCHASKVPTNWKHFYFACKNRRNLLKNPRGEDEFNGWTIVENGGHHWKIEAPMVPHLNEGVQKNFVTSFGMCLKSQLIDLEEEGYNSSFMDEIQPHIRISDWYAPRSDCGSEYRITVELLNNKKAVVQEFAPEPVTFPQWNDQQWNQMTHVFRDYGPGVRCIKFTHGGKDTQFWAGWYGIRVTDSCVEICPADDF
uniref:Zgc:153722 n=1 Tax=Oryzias latipes TaxID=8090 RepID=A0A3P9HHN2_ORYLA